MRVDYWNYRSGSSGRELNLNVDLRFQKIPPHLLLKTAVAFIDNYLVCVWLDNRICSPQKSCYGRRCRFFFSTLPSLETLHCSCWLLAVSFCPLETRSGFCDYLNINIRVQRRGSGELKRKIINDRFCLIKQNDFSYHSLRRSNLGHR